MKRALVLWALLCGAAQAQIGPTLGSPTGPGISSTLPSAFLTPGTPPTPRANYYVDSVAGSDAAGTNPCTAQGSPCATLARLKAVSPPANSNIWLKRGSYWREDLNVTGYGGGTLLNGNQIGAYGSGARPILDAADVISAGSWTKTGGLTNVYQATVTLAGTYSGQAAGMGNRIWEDGVRLTYVANTTLVDSTPGSWTGPTRPTGGADVIYVHATGSTNPASNGRVYEWPARPYGINAGQYPADANKIVAVTGVETRRHGHHDGGLLTSSYVGDFKVYVGGAGTVDPDHGLWCNGTCADGETTTSVSYGNNLPGATYRNVSVNCDSPKQGAANNGTGFFFHTGSVGSFKHGKITYDHVSGVGCETLMSGNSATQVLAIAPSATNDTVRQLASYQAIDRLDIISPTWIRTSANYDGNGVVLVAMGSTTICGGRFAFNRVAPYAFLNADNAMTGSVSLIGNTFAATAGPPAMGASYRGIASNRTSNPTLTMTRNVFTYVANGGGYIVYAPTGTPTVSSDYNLWDATNPPTSWNLGGTSYASLAAWQSTGRDTNSVSEAQSYVGSPAAGNFALVGGSAAWTLPAGADAYGDTYCAAYALTIP